VSFIGLGLLLVALAWHTKRAFAPGGLLERPMLLAASLLGVSPLVYVAVVWVGVIDDRYLRFGRPLLALPVAALMIWLTGRLLRLPAHWAEARRLLTEATFSLSALGIALATLGVELGRPLDRQAVIVVMDRSRSIDLVPEAESRLRAELAVAELGMHEDDRIGSIAFAAEAAVEEPLRTRAHLPAPQKVEIGRDGTDLGAAIRRALSEVPPDCAARIALVSDGVSTRGSPEAAAIAASAAGVPVDVVPLDQAKLANLRLVGLRMAPRATEHEPLDLRIVTQASAEGEIEVRVLRDGELVRTGSASVRRGEDVLSLRELAPASGLHRYDVEISSRDPKHDQFSEDNRGTTFLRVRGDAVALVLEADPRLAVPVARALESAGFRVDVAGPGGVPADTAGLASYDLVVLGDIRASDLASSQLSAFAAYTRDLGGGLLLLGGDRSFGPGGYGKTPIEDVSPVSFDLKQERRRASLAEVIAVDYSGSMGMRASGGTKLALANEAAVRSAELLGRGDRLGVMHVDTEVRWAVPLGPVADQASIAQRIRAVGPGGGGIYVDLALSTAYAALGAEKVNLKHVLLFADGNDAEEKDRAPELVRAAKRLGVTTSVVALGRGSDVGALEELSRLGEGRFYLIEDASRLPAVFAQETILAARSAINEVTFRPRAGAPSGATRGIDFGAAPPLGGYVVTIPKGRAQVLLSGPEGDPLLSTWSIGVGRAGVFTSDYRDRWGREWTSWTGAMRLFGQLGRELSRRAEDTKVRVEADSAGGQLSVRATVVDDDGRAESFRRLVARVAGPDGFRAEFPLEPVGAGAYAAELGLSRPGAFMVTVVDELGGQAVGTTGTALYAGEELRPSGSDRALLTRIAQLSGGKVRDTLAGIFHDRSARRFAYQDLSGLFLVVSALGLLGSVAARRLSLPERVLGAPGRVWRSLVHPAVRQAAPAPGTAHALLAAKRATLSERGELPRAPAQKLPKFVRPAPPVPGEGPPSGPAASPPAGRSLTTAEILLQRRRGRR
jgi:Ca-activated chloride channel family protein